MREAHVSDKNLVAHLVVALLILEKKVVLARYRERLFGEGAPNLAALEYAEGRADLARLPIVWKERDLEAALGNLRQLPGPLQRANSF